MQVLESILYPLVEELGNSPQSPLASRLQPDAPLLGPASTWDSIDLVTFIIAVEDRIERETGKRIHLITDAAMSQSRSPFRTLGTLAEYVEGLIQPASPEHD